MITKKLKPSGKLFTKDVTDRLMALAETPGNLSVVVFNERAIHQPFFDKLGETGRAYVLKTNESVEAKIGQIRHDNAKHQVLATDLSKRIQAIYLVGGKEYVLVTTKDIIAADESEYPDGLGFMNQILNYASELG